ncbi:hypothetical protein GEMRC1_007952 [Eukaryota sp. GEM-RC1]
MCQILKDQTPQDQQSDLVRAETDERGNPCSIANCPPLTDADNPQHFRVDTGSVLGNLFKKQATYKAQGLESKSAADKILKKQPKQFNTEKDSRIPYLTAMLDASNLLRQITIYLRTQPKLKVFQFHLY